ncbi:MAG: 30S ribosome-binding factor RbfA [Fidelibacterota bacterium]
MPHRPYSRKERFGHEVQRILGDLILKEIDTSDVGFVTITGVKMTNDLRLARVYISILNRKIPEKSVEKFFLERSKYLRKMLGSKISAKSVPELKFFYDESFEEVEKIERLLSEALSQKKKLI